MQSILHGVALGAAHRAEGYDPAVVEGDLWSRKRGMCCHRVGVGWDACDWLGQTQREDPMLNVVLDWLEAQKKTDLKTLLGEHASSEEGQFGLE